MAAGGEPTLKVKMRLERLSKHITFAVDSYDTDM